MTNGKLVVEMYKVPPGDLKAQGFAEPLTPFQHERPVRWVVSVLDDGDASAEIPMFRRIQTKFDAHDLIVAGLPTAVLLRLGTLNVDEVSVSSFCAALGISERTFHRYKSQAADKPLAPDVSGRLWKLAEIIGRATEALGSRSEADAWLQAPAMALDGRRPIDLLSSPTGVEAVEDLLTRLQYDVYT